MAPAEVVSDDSSDDAVMITGSSRATRPVPGPRSTKTPSYLRTGLKLRDSEIDRTGCWPRYRQMDCFEIKDRPNEFFLLIQAAEHGVTFARTLRGLILRRERELGGYFRDHPNEVLIFAEVDRADDRPWFAQGAVSIDPAQLGPRRMLHITSRAYPEVSYLEDPDCKAAPKSVLESSGPLFCRRMLLRFWEPGVLKPSYGIKPSENGFDRGSSKEELISQLFGPGKQSMDRKYFPWFPKRESPQLSKSGLQKLRQSLTDRGVVDICCGAGGASIGARLAGFHILGGIDIEQTCCNSYAVNTGARAVCGDICDLLQGDGLPTALQISPGKQCLLLHWSAPCQGLSQLNTRQAWDDPKRLRNNDIQTTITQAIKQLEPAVVTGEQTTGIKTLHGGWLDVLIDSLVEACGYNVRWAVKDFKEYGNCCQSRKRFLFIATKPGIPALEFPPATRGPRSPQGRPYLTLAEVLHTVDPESPLHFPRPYREPKSPYDADCQANCISTSGGDNYYPDGTRPFTLAELAAVQTFPPDIFLDGGKSEKRTQIGNAVPPGPWSIILAHVLEQLEAWVTQVESPSNEDSDDVVELS